MRTIQKTFSLEPMTSRMPSVWPAYKDNTLYFFDDDSLKGRDYKYPSNYGMIPMRVSFSSKTENDNVEYFLDCSSGATTISFERLNNWYHFFKEYYHLLNDYGHCNRTYSSATEYYYYESGARYADQMLYGTDEQTYKDLDTEFKTMGGKVNTTNIVLSGASDVGFYKWICDYIVPSYYISKEYVDYWKRSKLYYPDVIKWIAWFSSRLWYDQPSSGIYTSAVTSEGEILEKEHWDCKKEGVIDCCDCEEYFSRGGEREYKRMLDWYNNLQEKIAPMYEFIQESEECFIPTMDDKIQLYNSLDDLGQYSIFSKEYELGIDYRTARHWDSANTNSGTVVEMRGETMILSDNAGGFCFSPYYMEKIYDEQSWKNYTEKYMHDSLCPRCGYYGELAYYIENGEEVYTTKDEAITAAKIQYPQEQGESDEQWEERIEGHITDVCPICGYDGHDEEYGVISELYGDNFIRNEREFIADGYRFYAFDDNNVMYTGKTSGDVVNQMSSAYTYDIISANTILIDGVLYDIQESEYGTYDLNNQYMSGKTFFVYRERDTSTPYTLVNGKKVYAEWYAHPNPSFCNRPCYYFSFFKNKDIVERGIDCKIVDDSFNITDYKPFGRKYESTGACSGDVISYISYMGQIYEVDESGVTINETEYPRVSGYAYSVDNDLMYCISGHVLDSEMLNEIPNSRIDGDTIIIGLDYEPTIYSAKELSGHTVSRLTDLESTNVLIDDIGNKVDGKYVISGGAYYGTAIYNHQPPQGIELDLLYEVGNTSNIRRISGLTKEDIDEFDTYDTKTPNYFIGNIITSMVFYYKDNEGNVAEVDTVDSGAVTTKQVWEESSLKTIHKSQAARKTLENIWYMVDATDSNDVKTYKYAKESNARAAASTDVNKHVYKNGVIFDDDDIYCDVTYYVGATLGLISGGTYYLAYSGGVETNNYNYGVEYKETVKFVKENREYYLKKMVGKQIPMTFNSPSAHTISYPIYVYKLYQEMTDVETDIYGTYYEAPLAAFKTEINLINSSLTTNYSGYTDMDTYNNIHVTPTLKQEYMLGISSLENIDSDIYIERGINAAFERHLKLGEVTSLEALEQYSNGYFKIIEN